MSKNTKTVSEFEQVCDLVTFAEAEMDRVVHCSFQRVLVLALLALAITIAFLALAMLRYLELSFIEQFFAAIGACAFSAFVIAAIWRLQGIGCMVTCHRSAAIKTIETVNELISNLEPELEPLQWAILRTRVSILPLR